MRLIDADAIHFCEFDQDNYHWFRAVDEDEIAEMPTIDAVPVIRCKNCKYYNLQALACTHNNFNGWIGMDGFCSYGEYVTNSK